ncbi:hypothetical protein VNO77_03066 [Canavalia gladiata]|uniref:Uncharacterized protein n=1 Tax=Canavalia gladiata TaxID=3824 RepID=A0AAN9R3I8_CANGL
MTRDAAWPREDRPQQRRLRCQRDESGDGGEKAVLDSPLAFEDNGIRNTWITLEAPEQDIISDPNDCTRDGEGLNYANVFCASASDDHKIDTVVGIDLNHGYIVKGVPGELGFHVNLTLLCINTVPHRFDRLEILFKLDLNNHHFTGKLPEGVLRLPPLKLLDRRFDEFGGIIPGELLDKDRDATFTNDNHFVSDLPDNFGNSPVGDCVGEQPFPWLRAGGHREHDDAERDYSEEPEGISMWPLPDAVERARLHQRIAKVSHFASV